jgi:hypothetical protein
MSGDEGGGFGDRIDPERLNALQLLQPWGSSAAYGWPSLLRWIDEAVERALWVDIRAGPADASRHAHAHRIAMSLAGHAPHGTGGSLVHQACVGATRCV